MHPTMAKLNAIVKADQVIENLFKKLPAWKLEGRMHNIIKSFVLVRLSDVTKILSQLGHYLI